MAENLWFGQIIFGKAGEPKLNCPLWLLLFGRGFLSISLLLPLCHCTSTKMLHVGWKHLCARHYAYTKAVVPTSKK